MRKLSQISFLLSGISLVSMALVRYILGEWVPFCWLALGFFIFLGGFPFVYDRSLFLSFFRMKTTRKGLSMGTLILSVLALLIIVNVIGARKVQVFDFSSARVNTLSEQSVKLVKGLEGPLKIIFFYQKGVEGNEENRKMFRDLVRRYQDHSDQVFLDFVEVNQRPDLTKEYGVDKGSGIIFLEYQKRRSRIEKIDEQELTSAMVKVIRAEDKIIYTVVGHGERDISDGKEASGASALKELLSGNRYQIKELSFVSTAEVPKDAAALFILGPIREYQDFEVAAIEAYMKAGGNVLFAFESQQKTGLENLLARMGLILDNNYVLGIVNTVLGKGINQGPTVGIQFSKTHEITKSFPKSDFALFRNPTSLKKLSQAQADVSLEEIVSTNENSIAFQNLNFSGEGPTGPFLLGAAVKGKFPQAEKEFQALVFGDADFLSNQLLYQGVNRDLLLNSVASLVKEENLIAITPKEIGVTRLLLTDTNLGLFIFLFAIPFPVALFGASFALWYRRRSA